MTADRWTDDGPIGAAPGTSDRSIEDDPTGSWTDGPVTPVPGTTDRWTGGPVNAEPGTTDR